MAELSPLGQQVVADYFSVLSDYQQIKVVDGETVRQRYISVQEAATLDEKRGLFTEAETSRSAYTSKIVEAETRFFSIDSSGLSIDESSTIQFDANRRLAEIRNTEPSNFDILAEREFAQQQIAAIEDGSAIGPGGNNVSNQSQSSIDTLEKYQNSDATNATDESSYNDAGNKTYTDEDLSPGRNNSRLPPGGEPPKPAQPKVNFRNLLGDKSSEKDLRVRIRVPKDYLTPVTQGPKDQLRKLNGIIFPYTPSINYELKADYAPTNPIHSNFSINFYQRSSISSIGISGKFTVENQTDAGIYIATVHLLKALTRMRFGGDELAGAPPPVCRLYAYGQMMLENVPIAINSFKIELPDNVDYFTFRDPGGELASVPTISTIALNCITMYSRNEMQGFSVTEYLNNAFKGKGII